MLDLKDRMIVEYEERRDKTHKAVDDVEANVEGQPWCVPFEYATARLLSQSKDSSDNIVVRESTMVVRKCGSPDAGADCDVICCEYSYDEWEEERTEWMAEQMRRRSP
ncbi:uncharacterized protein BDV17DRAFT_279968 [Aspergillus undulatus]|uniref:uncharacterized protein n=1 Tax=Aspergillus undulatus TaxID=1810928 RepID=UPI003CCCBF1D